MAMNAPGDDPLEQRINRLHSYAEATGRDPASIGLQMALSPGPLDKAQRKKFFADADLLAARAVELKQMGFHWISIDCVPIFQLGFRTSDALLDQLQAIHERLLRALN